MKTITSDDNGNQRTGEDGVTEVRRPRRPRRTIPRGTASPTPTPLDLAEDKLRAHVVFPSEHESVAVVLWIAATHAQQAWDHATRMVIRSPIKRCGKSRLLDLVYGLSHEVMMTANVSVAALVHSIVGDDPPTILMDEADTIFGRGRWGDDDTKALRGLLNAGFQRNRPYIRWDPMKRQREEAPTFSMAALAGIGRLPDTIEDRAVIINLRRRRHDEVIKPFRVRDLPALEPLRDALGKWVRDRLPVLKQATPKLSLEDRDADVWEPLIAIADQAGGTWPERARAAANALTQGAEEDEAELLLLHIYEAFQAEGTRRMASRDLIEALFDREDGPWAAMWKQDVSREQSASGVWKKDTRVVGSKLAAMLKPFGIEVTKVKVPGTAQSAKGYKEEQFADTWARLGIGGGTKGTQGTTQVRLLREGTEEGTLREPDIEPDDAGSLQVPSRVPSRNGSSSQVPWVPTVPSALPRKRPLKRRRTTT